MPVEPLRILSDARSGPYTLVRSRGGEPLDVEACPAHLDELARGEWGRLMGDLAEGGQLRTLDRNLLAIYCTLYARWVRAEAKVTRVGAVIKAADGSPCQNPYLLVARGALDRLTVIGKQLGLSPAARGELRQGSQ